MKSKTIAGIIFIIISMIGFGTAISMMGSAILLSDPIIMYLALLCGGLSSVLFCFGLFHAEIVIHEKNLPDISSKESTK